MKNRNGQALIEFVIILPIFLLLLFSVIDFGKILYNKIYLENKLNDVIYMYKDGKSYSYIKNYVKKENKNISFKVINNKNYKSFYLTTKVYIVTPGLNIALDNPYIVEEKRNTYYVK